MCLSKTVIWRPTWTKVIQTPKILTKRCGDENLITRQPNKLHFLKSLKIATIILQSWTKTSTNENCFRTKLMRKLPRKPQILKVWKNIQATSGNGKINDYQDNLNPQGRERANIAPSTIGYIWQICLRLISSSLVLILMMTKPSMFSYKLHDVYLRRPIRHLRELFLTQVKGPY